jgi:hypothetical protein
MMPDNWGFVAAAYGLAAIVFLGYWRRLGRKEREITALRDDRASRSRPPSGPAHPRPEPASRAPLQ